jgi:hypothetical protein
MREIDSALNEVVVCLDVCASPNVTYLESGYGKDCVASCPSGMFINSNRICVSSCSPNIYDNVTKQCLTSVQNCVAYTGTA